MSNHVDWTPYTVRGARDPATFNDAQDALITASGTLDASNFAEEGLDERAVEDGIAVQHLWTITESTRDTGTPLTSGSFTTLAFSGTTFRETFSPDLSVGSDDLLQLRARLHLSSVSAGDPGLADNSDLRMRFAYQPNGGSSTAVAVSLRVREVVTSVPQKQATLSLFAWVGGPLTLDWFEVQYRFASGQGTPHTANFQGILFQGIV